MSGKERKPSTKTYVFLITYGILLYLGLQNFSAIKSVFSWAYAIMQPISYGVCIAFIINLFLRFFRERVFVGMANSHRPWERKLCPVISAVCTGLVAMILLALIIFMSHFNSYTLGICEMRKTDIAEIDSLSELANIDHSYRQYI